MGQYLNIARNILEAEGHTENRPMKPDQLPLIECSDPAVRDHGERNTRIDITCTLIMAAEEGVVLAVEGDRLQVALGREVDEQLRGLLDKYESPIVERLKCDTQNPDPFKDFLDHCCLFYRGQGLVAPVREVSHAYQQWARQSNVQSHPTALLNKRLRELGCEAINLDNSLFWEHICLYWPATASSSVSKVGWSPLAKNIGAAIHEQRHLGEDCESGFGISQVNCCTQLTTNMNTDILN